jgi:hypothetical protein
LQSGTPRCEGKFASAAKLPGVSRTTIYEYVPELKACDRPVLTGQATAAELEASH